ncbi:hypothetical protein GCM10023169_28320 [Georgenia halophila]|uniref:Gas vesicle protein n=1 Tax=Georgenia halophila TaxID=620889 RepID=A0ABP8LF75_9MICO
MSAISSRQGGQLEPQREREGTLAHVIETLLDKGLVLNADIMVSVAGVELLGIRIRAALASFDTAARYGLEFPAGTDTETSAWRRSVEPKDTCPSCGKTAPTQQLLEEYCPWCGWQSARALRSGEQQAVTAGEQGPDDDEGKDDRTDQPDRAGQRRADQARESSGSHPGDRPS